MTRNVMGRGDEVDLIGGDIKEKVVQNGGIRRRCIRIMTRYIDIVRKRN